MAEPSFRIDKWLWHARFARSRTLAQKLIQSGAVRVNRNRVRNTSQPIKVGDMLTIALAQRVLVVRVIGFGLRRGPAVEAQLLYDLVSDSAARGTAEPRPGVGWLSSPSV
jgi:ribosome-associated heat shock protein Hsp15